MGGVCSVAVFKLLPATSLVTIRLIAASVRAQAGVWPLIAKLTAADRLVTMIFRTFSENVSLGITNSDSTKLLLFVVLAESIVVVSVDMTRLLPDVLQAVSDSVVRVRHV